MRDGLMEVVIAVPKDDEDPATAIVAKWRCPDATCAEEHTQQLAMVWRPMLDSAAGKKTVTDFATALGEVFITEMLGSTVNGPPTVAHYKDGSLVQ
jgi:hypothetical protein